MLIDGLSIYIQLTTDYIISHALIKVHGLPKKTTRVSHSTLSNANVRSGKVVLLL